MWKHPSKWDRIGASFILWMGAVWRGGTWILGSLGRFDEAAKIKENLPSWVNWPLLPIAVIMAGILLL